jgi:hypothetical protein
MHRNWWLPKCTDMESGMDVLVAGALVHKAKVGVHDAARGERP